MDEIIKKLDKIEEMIDLNSEKTMHLLKILVRNQKSEKTQDLEDALKRSQALSVKQVEEMFNISRPWALRLMKSLAKINPNIRFIPGSKESQRPSRIRFVEEADYNNFNHIQAFLQEHGAVTLRQIKESFKLGHKDARLMMDSFCADFPEYTVDESLLFNNQRISSEDGIRIIKKPEKT